MKIKEITSQDRRDFTAVYVCEHCDDEVTSEGYDDENYHVNVIPNFCCGECGKKSPKNYRPLSTKYPADFVI